MLSIKKGIRSEEIRHKRQHVLFVEGSGEDAIDPTILGELFDHAITVEPLGPAFYIKSVAQALHRYHPTYYFLIDRDHHDEKFVDQCWSNFPDPKKCNLLVWRRREIENYFLDPEYLVRSKYCCVSKDDLERKILKNAQDRLFLDAANYVVVSIREELKENWIHKFSDPKLFSSREEALKLLKATKNFEQHGKKVNQKVSINEIEKRFDKYLECMTGGQDSLNFGAGKWLHLIQGKKILAQVIYSECFQVITNNGTPLSGSKKLNQVVKELIKQDESVQPDDFRTLKEVIIRKIHEMNPR